MSEIVYRIYTLIAQVLCGVPIGTNLGLSTRHYTSQAGKALPALVFGLVASVGSVGKKRLALPRLLVRAEAHQSETVSPGAGNPSGACSSLSPKA